MNSEQGKCCFCGDIKPVSRFYIHVANKHFDDNKKGCYSEFVTYCDDCGIEPKATENNFGTVDRQSDETRLTGELNSIENILCDIQTYAIRTSRNELTGDELNPSQAKERVLAWHETKKQKAIDTVDRFEVIDHRECFWCRGRETANYLQKDGSYKKQLCNKCDGSGIMGGQVYGAFSNAETSFIKVELSYQDDGKTLKVFVSDRELNKSKGDKI